MSRRYITPRELAALVDRRQSVRISTRDAAMFLADWLAAGVVEQPVPGGFRLTVRGMAMFGGWADDDPEDPAT